MEMMKIRKRLQKMKIMTVQNKKKSLLRQLRKKGFDTNVCQTTFYFYEKTTIMLKKADDIW